MNSWQGATKFAVLAFIGAALLTASAQTTKEFRYTVGPKSTVVVVNRFGPISVRPSTNNQVIATATLHSNKVEVDENHNGNRVELRSHFLQNATPQEGEIDYDLQVPADAMVNVRTATGSLSAQGLQGDVVLVGDAGPVDARNLSNASVHIKTLNGPIALANISNGQLDVTSIGGDVNMNSVTGSRVNVNTASGKIVYVGDFAGDGTYTLSNHSGDIDVTIPQNASVDITARSVTGSVQNDFPLAQKTHSSFASTTQGRSFAGTSNTAGSSVQLRSFSGKIRLKKQ
ncbi:MAG TPA: DUF4097 family beta strand repeat-containing protein [Terriglobales bacterium]|nr:DUF4097 family beta strand repeat-containing protein [Terriglobales bacterium]